MALNQWNFLCLPINEGPGHAGLKWKTVCPVLSWHGGEGMGLDLWLEK